MEQQGGWGRAVGAAAPAGWSEWELREHQQEWCRQTGLDQ